MFELLLTDAPEGLNFRKEIDVCSSAVVKDLLYQAEVLGCSSELSYVLSTRGQSHNKVLEGAINICKETIRRKVLM